MFDLNKNKEQNPIGELFNGLSQNQKMSLLNLLILVGLCDEQQANQDKVMEYLNTYIKPLGVRANETMSYFREFGQQRMIEDLQSLPKNQMEFLVWASWEVITCDGRPSEIEEKIAGSIFEKLGVNAEKYLSIIKFFNDLRKNYGG